MILVSGGSGFIGSHVVDRLVCEGFSVRVFDCVKPLREDVEWAKGDLSNEDDVLCACKGVETVFHLAAVSDVNVALTHFSTCLLINEGGTMNFLRAATAREVDRFILASTCWVYGNAEGVEGAAIPFPDHIYTKTKLGQEHLVYAWNKSHHLPYTILRYDIPYGPRMRENMAISVFVRKALRNEPITVFGNGEQGRCWIYVEDLAEGNLFALDRAGRNQIFNLAGSEFVSLNQIAEELRLLFPTLEVKHDLARAVDFQGSMTSVEKAEEVLGWHPKTMFREGLRKYVDYVKVTQK